MAAMEKNKVKFGLNKVHYAKITGYDEETGMPIYATPVRIPGAVSISVDAEGEAENFYADDSVYYVINNNSGYTGELELALIPLDFLQEILGERLDGHGVLFERTTDEVAQFAIMFEFSGDKHKIRHVLYCCTASRPNTEGSTIEESKEVKTETLSFTASPLVNGLVKGKTTEATSQSTYDDWYKTVPMPYLPSDPSAGTKSVSAKSA